MNIILFGKPASGKGTMAEMMIKEYGFVSISAGELLRQEAKKDTEKSKEINTYLKQGKLVPDRLILDLIKQKVNSYKDKNIIFDGFPRTLEQGKRLAEFMNIDYVLHFEVPDELVIRRISGRRQCPKCGKLYNIYTEMKPKNKGVCDIDNTPLIQRTDDTKEVALQRLKIYREQTLPLLKYYREKKIVYDIDSSDSRDLIFNRIQKVLGK